MTNLAFSDLVAEISDELDIDTPHAYAIAEEIAYETAYDEEYDFV